MGLGIFHIDTPGLRLIEAPSSGISSITWVGKEGVEGCTKTVTVLAQKWHIISAHIYFIG